MGLMEPGCKPEGFGRPVQPAASNRPRCRAKKQCLDDICVNFYKCMLGKRACAWSIMLLRSAETRPPYI